MTEIIHPAKRKIISIVGMMGAGKTTTGKSLSRRLGIEFNDSDLEMERLHKSTVAQLFKKEGEEKFKNIETETIRQIINSGKPQVLSIGGEAFDMEANRQELLSKTVTVWLKVDIETLIERVCRRDTRPILEQTGRDKADIMMEILKKREEFFQEADIHIDTTRLTRVDIIEEIIKRLSHFIRNYDS
jgi:shikimate kinase